MQTGSGHRTFAKRSYYRDPQVVETAGTGLLVCPIPPEMIGDPMLRKLGELAVVAIPPGMIGDQADC